MLGLIDAIQRSWEDCFTIVHWDRRKTEKIYYPAKELIHFEDSSHGIVMKERSKVLIALVIKVLLFTQNRADKNLNET